MKIKTYRNPVFQKYFFSYLLILLVSLLGFSFVLNFTVKDEYKKTIDSKNKLAIESLLDLIETQITGIKQINFSMQGNLDVISSRYNSNMYVRYAAINELRKYIVGAPIIKDVIYFNKLDNSLISASAASHIDGENYYIQLDKELLKIPTGELFHSPNTSYIKKVRGKTETLFYYVPIQVSVNYNTAYIINMKELNILMNALASPSITEIYLVDDNYGVIASNTDKTHLPHLTKIIDTTKEYSKIDNEIDAYVLNSYIENVKIVGFSDKGVVTDLVNSAFIKAYYALGVVAVLGIIIALIAMKITYAPLHRLMEKIGGVGNKGGIQSLEDAFVNTQIENHKLADKVNNYRVAMQKSIFDSVAYSNEENIEKALLQIDTFFDSNLENCIFVVKLKFKTNLPQNEVSEYVKQVLPSNGSCILIEKAQHEATYLINYPGNEDYKDKVIQMVFTEIHQDTGCIAAISSYSKNPMDIASLYENAKLASIFWDEHDVVLYDEVKDKIANKDNVSYPYKIFDRLSADLLNLNFEMAQKALTDLFELLNMKDNPEFFVRCILIDTLTLIINSMNKSNIKFEKYGTLYYETLFLCRSSDYEKTANEIVSNTREILSIFGNEVASSSLQISKVKKFIDENCMSSNFSVVMLSDEFGVSIAYMSFIFKKKTDINLSDYVWQLRLEKAKELLATDMSIEEISLKVGYENPSSFRRKFKEALGITPSQFRRDLKSS